MVDLLRYYRCGNCHNNAIITPKKPVTELLKMNICDRLLVQIYIFNRSVLTALTHRAGRQRSRSTLLNMVYLPLITWQSYNNKLQSTFSDCLPMINDD